MNEQPDIHVKTLSSGVVFPDELAEDSWMTPLLAWLTAQWAAEHATPQFTGVLEYLKDQQ